MLRSDRRNFKSLTCNRWISSFNNNRTATIPMQFLLGAQIILGRPDRAIPSIPTVFVALDGGFLLFVSGAAAALQFVVLGAKMAWAGGIVLELFFYVLVGVH